MDQAKRDVKLARWADARYRQEWHKPSGSSAKLFRGPGPRFYDLTHKSHARFWESKPGTPTLVGAMWHRDRLGALGGNLRRAEKRAKRGMW